jgi:hypothetical protein
VSLKSCSLGATITAAAIRIDRARSFIGRYYSEQKANIQPFLSSLFHALMHRSGAAISFSKRRWKRRQTSVSTTLLLTRQPFGL